MSKRIRSVQSNEIEAIEDVLHCLQDVKTQATLLEKSSSVVYETLHALRKHIQADNLMVSLLAHEKRTGIEFFHIAKTQWRNYCPPVVSSSMREFARNVDILCDDSEMLFAYVDDIDLRICRALFAVTPASEQFTGKLQKYVDHCKQSFMRNNQSDVQGTEVMEFFTSLLLHVDTLLFDK